MKKKGKKILLWVAIALAILAFVGGTGFYVKGVLDKRKVREAIRDAARRWGVEPDWLDAIAKHESGWNPQATNFDPNADGKYGGALGVGQMLWTNIIKTGWGGSQDAFLADPAAQADLMAKFASDGPTSSIEDFAAWWNSGKRTVAAAPAVTQTKYVPAIQSALRAVQSDPLA